MNPPPGGAPPSLLALGPMTLMIGITFALQAGAIYFNSRLVKEYRGAFTEFAATLSMSIGYLVMIALGQPSFAIGITSNIAIYTGNTLMYIAICQFTERPLDRWAIYGVVPLGYLALLLTFLLPIPIIVVTDLVNIPLSLASGIILLRANTRGFQSGARFTAIPLIIYALLSFARMVSAIISPREIAPGESLTNTVSILLVFILSYLWTAGFILMITQRLQSDLNDLAMNDMLTRVRNRRAMHELLNFELKRKEREVKDFSIILLDVDHFKRVNDTYGHDIGDEVLKWMAQNLQAAARVQDTVSRWGGEEFLILLPSTTLEDAFQIAERIRAHIEATPFVGQENTLKITFSAGVSCSSEYFDIEKLCKVADEALYIAKRTRNRVVPQNQIELEYRSVP